MRTPSEKQSLEQKAAELRSTPMPSAPLVDALNTLTLELVPVDLLHALATAQEARSLARLLKYQKGTITSLARLSWIHLQIGEFDLALREAQEAQFFAEQIDDYVLILQAQQTLVHAYQQARDVKKAEAGWQKMLSLAQAHNDKAREADYWLNFGLLYLDLRDYRRALELTKRAKELFMKLNDAHLAMALNNIAFALTNLGCSDEALTLAEDALARCDPGWTVWRAEFLHTLGVIRLNREEYDLARAGLDESLALSLAPGGRKHLAARVLMDIAKLELAHNDTARAFTALERAHIFGGEAQSHTLQAEAQYAISALYMLAHAWDQADYYHDRYLGHKNRVAIGRIEKEMSLIRVAAEMDAQHPIWAQRGDQ